MFKRAMLIYSCLLLLFLLAPSIIVIVSSFGADEVTQFPPRSFSLRWYANALSQPIFLQAAKNSAWLAAVATGIATPIALAASVALVRSRFPGRDALQSLLLAPLVVPAIVTGLAILVTLSAFGLRDVTTRLVGAHVVIVFPYLVRTITVSLTQIDSSLEECARTLGASGLTAFWYVTLPLIRPGIVAGMLFSFILSFDNVSASLFLTNVRTNTLPLAMLNYVEFNFDPSLAAISTMVLVLAFGIAFLVERVVGLKRVVGG